MKIIYKNYLQLIALTLAVGILPLKAQIVQTYSYTGSLQTLVVPSCVANMTVEVWGAQGASTTPGGSGGLGGYAKGTLTVSTGQILSIYVGGQNGYNGGALGGINGNAVSPGPTNGNAGNGGGATDIRIGGTALANRVIVAGGGGGGGHNGVWTGCQTAGPAGNGGLGGGVIGGTGTGGTSGACNCTNGGGNGGFGGTASAGGATGTYNAGGCLQTWGPGLPGTLGNGGAGSLVYHNGTGGGGGGGGGYYGGGSGANGSDTTPGGGGGGGSSFTGLTTNTVTTSGARTGDGLVTLTYFYNGAGVTATATPSLLCTGASCTLAASNVLSYTWTPGGSNATNITVSPTSNTSYTVQGTNSLGCISFVILTVTVNSGVPVLSVVNSTTSICPTNTVMLTASGAVNYSWTGNVSNGVPFSPPATANYTVTGTNGCGSSTAVTGVTVTSLPVVALANPTLICAANPAILSTAGAITYTWMPGGLTGTSIVVSPTATTVYTVTGSSPSCFGVATLTLPVNPNPTISISPSATLVCAGASVNLTASGALSYTWQPGGSTGPSLVGFPQGPTLYSASGTNTFGCVSSAQQPIVTTPAPIVTAITNLANICLGGSVTLTAGGANTYTWSTGASGPTLVVSPPASTTFIVIGTNTTTGCSNSKTVSVSVYAPALIVSNSSTVCQGTQVSLNASGASTYSWSTGQVGTSINVTPAASTVFIVSSITNTNGLNCPSSGTIVITVNLNPTVTAMASRTVMCKGEKNILTGGGALSYTWSNGATTNTVLISPGGSATLNYSVTGTDTNGCVNTAGVTVKVNTCNGLNEILQTDFAASIFPNPTNGLFTVHIEEAVAGTKVLVYNALGIMIRSQAVTSENTEVDLEKEAAGIYFLELLQNNKAVYSSKIIKQ